MANCFSGAQQQGVSRVCSNDDTNPTLARFHLRMNDWVKRAFRVARISRELILLSAIESDWDRDDWNRQSMHGQVRDGLLRFYRKIGLVATIKLRYLCSSMEHVCGVAER